jgi:hypothetical protein
MIEMQFKTNKLKRLISMPLFVINMDKTFLIIDLGNEDLTG